MRLVPPQREALGLDAGGDVVRILTVRQPWAHAILHGGKDVENRTRNVAGSYRGPVAIHAGLQRDDRGWVEFRAYALTRTMHFGHPDALGAIIGMVDLVDVHHETSDRCGDSVGFCSDWAERGVHHLVLANPRPLEQPIPYKGMLGLRRFNDTVDAGILRTLEELS